MKLKIAFHEPLTLILYQGASILKRIVLLPRSIFRLRHVEIKGIAKGDDSNFSLHYIGEGESLDYLKNLCFSSVNYEKVVSCNIWEIKNKTQDMWDSIVIIETNRLLKSFVPDHG